MAGAWLYSIVSVLIVSLLSIVGVLVLAVNAKRLQSILIYFVSFSAGALFGNAFIHLLPEAAEKNGFTLRISIYIILGIVVFFVVEKLIREHRHHLVGPKHHATIKPFAIMNLIGDGIHNFIDGLLIAGSYLVSIPVGIATTLAVIFHEIPQEIGDFGVLLEGGFSRWKALLINFLTALSAFVGVFFGLILNTMVDNMTLFLIPFTAGGFIYIAGSDLLPELLHKEEDLAKLSLLLIAFLVGVAVMVGLLFI